MTDRTDGFRGLEVLAPGALSLIQDAGRFGYGAVGVGRSGAADGAAFRRGAALLGNTPDCAAIEVLFGGLTVRAHGALSIVVTGAAMPVAIDGVLVDRGGPWTIPDGAAVALGSASVGLRGYLSVRGGITVPTVLGSRSTDTLAGLGPAKLGRGDRLPIGPTDGPVSVAAAAMPTSFDPAPPPDSPGRATTVDPAVLAVTPGPRLDWFADPEQLVSTRWVMSAHSDRIGLRLTGGVLTRIPGLPELPSEGMVLGCLQVPPSGEPVLLMPDHPVTGGYPVIGVVTEASMELAAQLRPGQSVRFRWRRVG
jgi:biotin-dependent carboxylase-like uncharacterized protein